MTKILSSFHAREIIFSGMLGFAIRILSAGSAFLMSLFISRGLGPTESGIFFLGFSLVSVLSSIGCFGLDQSLVRFVGAANARSDFQLMKGVYKKSIEWCLLFCIILMLFVWQFREYIYKFIFKESITDDLFVILLWTIPIVSLYTIHAHALQGLKKVAKSIVTINLIAPSLVLIGFLLVSVSTARETAVLFMVGCVLSLLIGSFWWLKSVPNFFEIEARPINKLWSSSYTLWGVVILSQCTQWSSQIMLGVWADVESVALFSAAQRTAMLTSFVLVGVNAIVAPKYASLYAEGDLSGVREVSIWSVRLMLATSIPILIFIFMFPSWLMSLFGDDFRSASTALVILAVGQFINVATGSVGYLLSMTGHERQLRKNVFWGSVLGVGFGLLLIPLYGLLGGAISTAVAVSLQNLMGVYQVNRIMGFNTLIFWKRYGV
ncbi:polysaccharide biosynthesis protein [Marinobacterium lacunae]|uniref:Polysaccharide biosynthesis protein n=1 Tax=Marinobacterium lacunae TaxID=1232683 RepID=A0A081G0C0_9GAMM|nr:MATE family efflux transporter [Marinobacterium lacunae]KEA64225.1 polysaccharide biosynthesis protein [Marinobacterium lacunae]